MKDVFSGEQWNKYMIVISEGKYYLLLSGVALSNKKKIGLVVKEIDLDPNLEPKSKTWEAALN